MVRVAGWSAGATTGPAESAGRALAPGATTAAVARAATAARGAVRRSIGCLLVATDLDAVDGTGAGVAGHRETSLHCAARRPVLAADAQAARLGARLAAGAHVELAQDRRDVVADRLLGDEQPVGDLGVADPLAEKLEHLDLASGEACGVVLRRGTRP